MSLLQLDLELALSLFKIPELQFWICAIISPRHNTVSVWPCPTLTSTPQEVITVQTCGGIDIIKHNIYDL